MPAPIIAAYEPYTDDRAPVTLALAASELSGASVIAVAVHPSGVSEAWSDKSGGDAEDDLRAAMQKLEDEFGVETRIIGEVSVARGLHKLAEELQAGLITVGSTDRGAVGRVLIGSTAERVIQGAPCPVAVAPHGFERKPLETIAVGFVDSPEGHAALEAAHALAARAGARLRVIAALHPSGGLDAALADGLKPPRGYMLEGRHRAEVQAALDRAIAALPGGAEIEPELHVDDPAELLLRVSEHVDLLVCGSRGYGPLRSVLLGGVSRKLVDAAQCPVLVLGREVTVPLEDLRGAAA